MARTFHFTAILLAACFIFSGCSKEEEVIIPPGDYLVGNWEVLTYMEGSENLLNYYVNESRYDSYCGYYDYQATGTIESFWEFVSSGSYSQTWITTYNDAYDYYNFYCQNVQNTNIQDIETATGTFSFLNSNEKLVLTPNSGTGVMGVYDITSISNELLELQRSITVVTALQLKKN